MTELLAFRDRLVAAAEDKNRQIYQLERRVKGLGKERRFLVNQLAAARRSAEDAYHKRPNGQLYSFMGRALLRLSAHDTAGAAALLSEALSLTPEQLDELSFKASLEPRNGRHANGNHFRGPDRNEAIRKRIRPSQRRRIFDRDHHRCRDCGTGGDELNPLTIDHVIPVARGGTNNDTNLQTLCNRCNLRKNVLDPMMGPPLRPDRHAIRRSWEEPRPSGE